VPRTRSAPPSNLDAFFRPRTIAVIGASRNPWKLGYAILDNLQRSRFPGAIYPVNPVAREVLGLKAYASVLNAPRRIDLAVVVVSAPQVAPMLEECGQKGAKGALIITAGFRETGADGLRREQELMDIARRYRMRLVGPNSLGVLDTFHNLNASFGEGLPRAYEIAVLSHSGAMASALLDWAALADIGFSKFVSLGNSADVNETDLLEHWAEDREAKVIIGYLEGIHEGRRFLDAARKVTARKPLVIMKVGGTSAGARAMASHTGALATSEAVVDAAFRQTGIVRAHTMQELFDFIPCFSYCPLPAGTRVAVVTNAGGPGVMAADALERQGLSLAELSARMRRKLRERLPDAATLNNPIDLRGDAPADSYLAALEALLAEPDVDAILALFTPQAVSEPERTARVLISVSKGAKKPILAVYMGGLAVSRATDMLEKARVPVYSYPERAVHALHALTTYARYRASI